MRGWLPGVLLGLSLSCLKPMTAQAVDAAQAANPAQAVAAAQTAAPGVTQPEVQFTFERAIPGVMVPRYMFLLRADGTGAYRAEVLAAKSADVQTIDRPVRFSPATVKLVMEALEQMRSSDAPCDAKVKHLAQTGMKTLAYRAAPGAGTGPATATCTYNYSENKGVTQLTGLFQGMETAMESGRALDFKHRFDRLGLDAEMASLVDATEAGRAVGLELIAPTLQSIAGDTELIQRVRLRAAKLLERAQAGG